MHSKYVLPGIEFSQADDHHLDNKNKSWKPIFIVRYYQVFIGYYPAASSRKLVKEIFTYFNLAGK